MRNSDRFISGESFIACCAPPAPADAVAVVVHARIDDLGINGFAEGTMHGLERKMRDSEFWIQR
jgi:hypothetical protein